MVKIINSKIFIRISRIVFCSWTFLVLGLTTFFRDVYWPDPLCFLYGGWTIAKTNGKWDINPVLNIGMLIPFTFFLFSGFRKLSEGRKCGLVIMEATAFSFCFSLIIECTQLLTKLGTFQISDLTYNTLSGIIGAVIFLVSKASTGGR